MNVNCASCAQPLRKFEDNTWFFMYVSTAGITGVFLIGMFLVVPTNAWLARFGFMAVAAVAFLATHARRKGFAIGFEIWMDSRVEHPKS